MGTPSLLEKAEEKQKRARKHWKKLGNKFFEIFEIFRYLYSICKLLTQENVKSTLDFKIYNHLKLNSFFL